MICIAPAASATPALRGLEVHKTQSLLCTTKMGGGKEMGLCLRD